MKKTKKGEKEKKWRQARQGRMEWKGKERKERKQERKKMNRRTKKSIDPGVARQGCSPDKPKSFINVGTACVRLIEHFVNEPALINILRGESSE